MEDTKVFSVIYNSTKKYVCVKSTKITDILEQASLTFGISTNHYDLCLYTEDSIELSQEVFDVIIKDLKLSYEKSFLLKSFQNYESYNDSSTQTEINTSIEVATQTNYEATPVSKQDCFIGSLPKKIKMEKYMLKEELETYLLNHPEAKIIIERYISTEILEKKLRVKLVNIIVSHLIEVHGTYPSSDSKTLWAQATALIFPKLCENHNPEQYEIFYNPVNRSGFFAFRLRTINRSLNNSSRISKNSTNVTSTEESEDEIDDFRDDIDWLKQACSKNDTKEIFLRMAKTIKCRPSIFTFEEFPRFLDTPGLIDLDFDIVYGEATFLKENWPRIKTKIRELGIIRKIKIFEEHTQEYEKFDDNISVLLILKHLCRTYRKKNVSLSEQPYSFIVFEKTGTTTSNLIKQPHLVLRGPSKNQIISYSINIDSKEIPLSLNITSIVAFTTLFKAFYVFNCQYPVDQESFYLFIQEAFFRMNKTPLTPRLMELKNMLGC